MTERVKPVPMPLNVNEVYSYGKKLKHEIDQALYYFVYIIGPRISESKKVREGQFDVEFIDKDRFLAGQIITLKTSGVPFRSIGSPVRLEAEHKMVDIIKAFFDINEDELPFDPKNCVVSMKRTAIYNRFKRQIIIPEIMSLNFNERKYQVLENWGIHPHFLRHCRAAHLVSYHGYDIFQLMRHFGWQKPEMAMNYVQYDWRSLAREVRKNWTPTTGLEKIDMESF